MPSRSRKRTVSRWTKAKPSISGTGEQLGLAFPGERRPLLAGIAAPGERVARRLLDRAERQAGGERPSGVRPLQARVLRTRRPQRQLRPRLHARGDQPLLVGPDEPRVGADGPDRALEQLTQRHRLARPGGVEDTAGAVLAEPQEPDGEVARVD